MDADTTTERPAVAVGGGGGQRWRVALAVIVLVAAGVVAAVRPAYSKAPRRGPVAVARTRRRRRW